VRPGARRTRGDDPDGCDRARGSRVSPGAAGALAHAGLAEATAPVIRL